MRITHFSGGVSLQRHPLTETPRTEPPEQSPTPVRPLDKEPPTETPGQRPTKTKIPWTETLWKEHLTRQPDRKWHHTEPLWTEWQTCVKTLAYPNIKTPYLAIIASNAYQAWGMRTKFRRSKNPIIILSFLTLSFFEEMFFRRQCGQYA